MEKKELYEAIMANVGKEVKKVLLEFSPQDYERTMKAKALRDELAKKSNKELMAAVAEFMVNAKEQFDEINDAIRSLRDGLYKLGVHDGSLEHSIKQLERRADHHFDRLHGMLGDAAHW